MSMRKGDLLSKPYVMMTYFSPDNPMYEPSKDYYDEGADLEPITLGDYTWKGFTAKSLDTENTVKGRSSL